MPQLVVDRASGVPVHLQIRQHLQGRIEAGELAEGEQLPPLKTMARQYGTAYATMHRIVKDMEHAGLVRGVRGKGVFVQRTVSDARPRTNALRLQAPRLPFNPEESAYVQNEFQRSPYGGRVELVSDSPDVLSIEADKVGRLAENLVDVRDVIESTFGRKADESSIFGPLAVDGNQFLVPLNLNVSVMFCNADLFESAGIALPTDGWTWEDCLDMTRALAQPSKGIWGLYPSGIGDMIHLKIWQDGGKLFSSHADQCLLETPEAIDTAKLFRSLVLANGMSMQRDQLQEMVLVERFAQGKAAMVVHNRWFPEMMRRSGSTVRWQPVPFPTNGDHVNILRAGGLALRKDSPVPDLAREYMRLAASWETWPSKRNHWYGFRVHARLERGDGVERVFKHAIASSRTPLSDVLPKYRESRLLETSDLLRSSLDRIVLSAEPVAEVMHHTVHMIEAFLNRPKEEGVMPIGLA